MIPRKRLDIEWSDLAHGIARCFLPGDREKAEQRVEEFWSSSSDTAVCLSVRTGFDLLFESLALPPGSEILISALNIRSMFDVIQRHQLVAIPIDLDMATMEMKRGELERAVNEKTRAILTAQLFGSRRPIDDVVRFGRQHDLLVIEDCAQAFCGDGYLGHPDADVVMVSFGPIKTCSTIMGGVIRFADPVLCERVKELHRQLPVYSRWQLLLWLIKFGMLKVGSNRTIYGWLLELAERQGWAAEINRSVRIFGGDDEFIQCRRQPPYPLLALLESRLRRFDRRRIEQRVRAAQIVIDRMPFVRRPAESVDFHTHWIFPVEVCNPIGLMHYLRERGFDSIDGYASFIVPDPPAAYPEFTATEARRTMSQVLYLPVHLGLSEAELIRLATAVTEYELAERERVDGQPEGAPRPSVTASRLPQQHGFRV